MGGPAPAKPLRDRRRGGRRAPERGPGDADGHDVPLACRPSAGAALDRALHQPGRRLAPRRRRAGGAARQRAGGDRISNAAPSRRDRRPVRHARTGASRRLVRDERSPARVLLRRQPRRVLPPPAGPPSRPDQQPAHPHFASYAAIGSPVASLNLSASSQKQRTSARSSSVPAFSTSRRISGSVRTFCSRLGSAGRTTSSTGLGPSMTPRRMASRMIRRARSRRLLTVAAASLTGSSPPATSIPPSLARLYASKCSSVSERARTPPSARRRSFSAGPSRASSTPGHRRGAGPPSR